MIIKIILLIFIFAVIGFLSFYVTLKRSLKGPLQKILPKKFFYQKSIVELTKIITNTDDIHDLLCLLVDNLSKILKVNVASFFILGKENDVFHINKAVGLGIENHLDYINEHISILFKHLEKYPEDIISIDNLKRRKKLTQSEIILKDLFENIGFNSVFPLLHKGEIIGTFNIGTKEDNTTFNIDEFDLINIILNYTQVAIVNSKLYSHFENTTRNLELSKIALMELSQNLTEERNILSQRIKEKNKKIDLLRQGLNLRETLLKEMLSVVSHELKSPLASIKTYTELMQMKKKLGTKQKAKYLDIINEEIDRLTRLINNLLDISKIESGKIEWDMGNHEIKPLIQRSIQAVNGLAKKRNINISTKFTKGLGLVSVDPDRIIQVMTNLLSNAIKFSPDNENIFIETTKNGHHEIHIKVKDNGPGIDKEDEKIIFDKFVSLSHKKGKSKGSGLGLTITRDIIQHHKGKIWIEKEEDRGGIFCFSLPQMGK